MKDLFVALTALALMFGAVAANAEDSAKMNQGASESSPGHQMQNKSSPGASEYAPEHGSENLPSDSPGQQMQDETYPGASAYAPGHNKDGDTQKE